MSHVHTTSKKLKMNQMLPIHTILDEFKNTTITRHFVFEENPSSFSKSSITKMFSIHTEMQSQRFQIPPA